MKFNQHPALEGKHAFLGASKFTWTRWSDETLKTRYYNQFSKQIGTSLHELAQKLIKARIKLDLTDTKIIDLHLHSEYIPIGAYDSNQIILTLAPFVNDAIGFRMESEVVLFYSMHAFGTADAIIYNDIKKELRVHDYKSGISPASMEQLIIYAALFCLEYRMKPENFTTILRIYQGGEIIEHTADHMEIESYMNTIITKSKDIQNLMEGDFSDL